MRSEYKEFIQRISDSLDDRSSLGRLSKWVAKYTYIGGRPFSFRDHEWQAAILDSRHHNVAIMKCSQVGLSEIATRFVLAFLATNPETVAIITYPALKDAQRYAKSRIDPVIQGSKHLLNLMAPGADSSMFKMISTSQLHLSGTYGKAIISIPTDLLVSDETDFSNAEALVTAESRLTHSRFVNEATGERGLKRSFSTPTVHDFGVSALYARSDQRRYMCRCRHCTEWFWPQFLEHAVVDGWDRPMTELTYMDAIQLDEAGKLDSARILCPNCHHVITRGDLGATYREWVAEYPEKVSVEGWAVSPLDMPAYHYAPSLMRKLIGYRAEVGHFRNFTLGLPYTDASNSILNERVRANTVVAPVSPEEAKSTGVYGTVAGLDLGKTSWFLVGKPYRDTLQIIWAEQIRLRDENGSDLQSRVLYLLEAFGVWRLVTDSMPYTDSVLAIQAAKGQGTVLPCSYNLSDRSLRSYEVKEHLDKPWEVLAHRTKSLNNTTRLVNSGQVKFPLHAEMSTVEKHLQGMKRVDRVDGDGEQDSNWVKTGDDHYFHALNYLSIAADVTQVEFFSGWAPVPTIGEVSVGQKWRAAQERQRP